MQPLVSIVMPTCNRAQFLAPAVAAVFAQTLPDWELLIADDGSDADTRRYLASLHAPPRITVLWLAHSGRPSVARNAALRAARGEYVAFLDSDDLWLPPKLERQLASLRRHPHRQWSYTAFALLDAHGRPRPGAPCRAPSGWIMSRLLREEITIALPSVLVRRAVLMRLGAFNEELVMCEDDELWLRLAVHSEIDGVDEPLTLIRRHQQHSGDDLTAWRDRRRVMERALSAPVNAPFTCLLRRLRARTAAGLALSEAASGRRLRALATLAMSAPYSWRYRQWWRGAARALLTAGTPAVLRARAAGYRRAQRLPPPQRHA